MKAVVVIPPVFDFYYTPHRSSGLGGEIVLTLLRANGWQARLLNFPRQTKRGLKQDLPSGLGYLTPFLLDNETGKISFFNQYKRFGPSLKECARLILAENPDLVLISCFAFCYADTALGLAELLRRTDSRPLIVCGGAGVSADPEYFIKNTAVDFAFTGEAEVFLPSFLDLIASGSRDYSRVPNLFYKTNGQFSVPVKVRRTEPDEIQFVFKPTLETSTSIIYSTAISRGCPKACRFCPNFISQGRRFRTVPVEKIKDFLANPDLKRAKESGKQVYINFEDDNFLCDPVWFFSALDQFKAVFPQAGFLAENGIDYTLITPDILEKLIGYGMKQFNLSMMSADTKLLDHENRPFSRRLYETITGVLKERNIPCITYFICGLKEDSREKVVTTLVYLAGQPTRVGISLFYPVPGIYDFQDKRLFTGVDSCLCAGTAAYPWNRSLGTREMVTAFRLARFVNLNKSNQRTATDDMVIEKSTGEQRLYTQVKKGRDRELVPVPDLDDEMIRLFFRKASL